MRDKTPTMEVNNADTVTLDARMGRALREYLPIHFPQVTRYFTGLCNIEEEVKDTDEGDASGEESFDEDEEAEAEESADLAAGESGADDASGNSVESADAREYVVPSSHGATAGGNTESTPPTSAAPIAQPTVTAKTKRTKAAVKTKMTILVLLVHL